MAARTRGDLVALACGLVAAICLALAATSVSAELTEGIVEYTEHVLDTKDEFEDWCRKRQGRLQRRRSDVVVMTTCRWKDENKLEIEAVRMVDAKRIDRGSGDCMAVHYPQNLYVRVDKALRAKFGAKTRTVRSSDGIVSKGWTVVLKGRSGVVSNLTTGGNGVVYGCLVDLRETEN